MEISKKDMNLIEKYSKAYVNGMYKDFQNPEMCGENFKWENFPDIAGRIVYNCLFADFPEEEKYYVNGSFREDLKILGRDIAIKEAKRLINK